MELRLWTKEEQEERTEAFFTGSWSFKNRSSLEQEWKKTRSQRLAAIKLCQKTGKVPAGFMRTTAAKFGGAMLSEKEAARVVLPRFPKPANPCEGRPLPTADGGMETIEGNVVERYLEAMGALVVEMVEEKPWPSANYTVKMSAWTCGCRTRDGRVKETCGKHKRALVTGAEEDQPYAS